MKVDPSIIARLEAEGRVQTGTRRATQPREDWAWKPLPVTLSVPTRLYSEMNRRDHWAARFRRFKGQREAVVMAWYETGLRHLGCFPRLIVTFTVLGPRRMDDDNCAGACKACRDAVAALLDCDDADPRVEWRYEQRKEKKHGLEITLEEKP